MDHSAVPSLWRGLLNPHLVMSVQLYSSWRKGETGEGGEGEEMRKWEERNELEST